MMAKLLLFLVLALLAAGCSGASEPDAAEPPSRRRP